MDPEHCNYNFASRYVYNCDKICLQMYLSSYVYNCVKICLQMYLSSYVYNCVKICLLMYLSRYVTRFNVKDSSRHVILGTQQFKPTEFGLQINLK